MTSFLTHRRALVTVVTLLLLSCVVGQRWSTAVAGLPASVVEAIATPLRWPLSALGGVIRGPGDATPPIEATEAQLRDELAHLHRLNQQMEWELRAAHERIAMLTQSREIALTGATEVEARVTGTGGDRTQPTLLIDKGSSRGILPDAPVVSGVNLVGRVKETSPATSRVVLITAAESRLQVRIRPPIGSRQPRDTPEQLQRSDDGPWFEVQLAKDAGVQVGDWAQLADDLWPPEAQGFVVGRVTRIEPDPSNPLRFDRAVIEAVQPLAQLRRVVVRVPIQ